MEQIKIGKFIAECRKNNNLTQMQLAEKLNITDRAISKWENGKAMPDSGVMLDLCAELKISVNELLSGEMINMNEYNEKAEQNLLEMKKQKEEVDKLLLRLEIIIGVIVVAAFLVILGVAAYADMADNVRYIIIATAAIPFFAVMFVLLGIEQKAGYYECQECHYKYVPTYSSVLCAMHMGRTRYMKSPECGKKSWQKKVISK